MKIKQASPLRKYIVISLAVLFSIHLATGQTTNEKITTFLMFEGNAEEAVNFYVSLFPESEIVNISRYGPGEQGEEGSVNHATFTLSGRSFMAIDSPGEHPFTFTPSISIFVQCETEDEVDMLFEKLSEGGEVLMPLGEYPFSEKYAWVNDRFGVSWQLAWQLRVGQNEGDITDNSNSLSLDININASAATVWDVITNPKYAKVLGSEFDENAFIKSDWQEGSEVHFVYEPDNVAATGIITELVEHKLIKMDYDFDGFAYNETFAIDANNDTVTLSVHAGPYGENIDDHRVVWKNWLKKVKELSENS